MMNCKRMLGEREEILRLAVPNLFAEELGSSLHVSDSPINTAREVQRCNSAELSLRILETIAAGFSDEQALFQNLAGLEPSVEERKRVCRQISLLLEDELIEAEWIMNSSHPCGRSRLFSLTEEAKSLLRED